MASRLRIPLRISLSSSALALALLAMAAAATSYAPALDLHLQHQRTLLIVAGAAAAAALVAAWTSARSQSGRGLDVNALFGRQLEMSSLKRRASTPPSRDDGSRELRDLPQRAPLPPTHSPSPRWHLLPTPPAPASAPELTITPLQRKYLARVSERLRRAAALHGLSLTASSSSSPSASSPSSSFTASSTSTSSAAAVPSSLSLHAGSLTPTSSPSSGPRISLTTSLSASTTSLSPPAVQIRLLVSLHARDAEEACAKGWASRAPAHFGFGFSRDRHAVEIARAPVDDAELGVLLEIVDAGVKYLRSQAADFLCNEILDLVF